MSGGADDRLLFGAAAPATQRVIGSIERLDALWALVCAAALIVASAFDLVERGAASLRMGEAPLRIAAWIIPALSIVVAVLAVVRRSAAIAAISTGLLAPCVALAGVLSLTLFLDRASAFTDVGVPLTLGAAFVGVAMLVRWFVYHPGGADIEESRPIPVLARSLVAVGVVVGIVATVAAVDRSGAFTVQFIAALMMALVVPTVCVAAGVSRTRPAALLASVAAAAQILVVLVIRLEESAVELGSDLTIWTGVPGMIVLATASGIALAAWFVHAPDEASDQVVDDEPWRWSADD